MTPTIAIIGALEKEVRQIYTSIEHGTVCEEAGLKIIGGEYHGFNIVSTTAGMGTVNAAYRRAAPHLQVQRQRHHLQRHRRRPQPRAAHR